MDLFNQPKPRQKINLRWYQEEGIEKLMRGWLGTHGTNFHRRQLMVLATGLGKTICFAAISHKITETFKGRVLILAHREELLEQALDKTKDVYASLGDAPSEEIFGWEQGARKAHLEDKIVVASVATLGRSISDPTRREYKNGVFTSPEGPNDRLARFPKDHFKLIVIDEAHHATADTYQRIVEHFPDAWVLGVTATPKRSDKESLKNVFDRVAYKMDIVDGTRHGFLVPLMPRRVSSKTDLAGIKTTAGDFNIKALAERVNNAERNSLIVQTYLDDYKDRQCIVFATDLDHARALDVEFGNAGIKSCAISGDMDKEDRRYSIDAFKRGEITVLTNYGVLTEGFDHASLDLIINARPTKSMLLLTQIAGRGTRLFDGKPWCDFVEITDNHSEETATCAQIFGFNHTFDNEGKDMLYCVARAEQMEKERDDFNPWVWRSISEMELRFKQKDEWAAASVPNQRNAPHYDNVFRFYLLGTDVYGFKVRDSQKGEKVRTRVYPDPLGGYTAEFFYQGKDDEKETKTHAWECNTLYDATARVAAHMKICFPEITRMQDVNAPWKRKAAGEPCTDKQFYLLQKFRLTRGRTRDEITKLKASQELDAFFNNAKRA